MKGLIGFIKFIVGIALCISILIGMYFGFSAEDSPLYSNIIVGTVFTGIIFFPAYYLFKTSLWDRYNIRYKKDIIVRIGLVVYIILTLGLILYSIVNTDFGPLWPNVILGVPILFIGIKDAFSILSKKKPDS